MDRFVAHAPRDDEKIVGRRNALSVSPTPTAVIASDSEAIHADATHRPRPMAGFAGWRRFAMTALERAGGAH
jgi:hypothetical protein